MIKMAVYPDWINCLKASSSFTFVVIFYHFADDQSDPDGKHLIGIVKIHARDPGDLLDPVGRGLVMDVKLLRGLGKILIIFQIRFQCNNQILLLRLLILKQLLQ